MNRTVSVLGRKEYAARNGVYRSPGYVAACNYRHPLWCGTTGVSREEAERELREHREQEHGTFPGGAR